jgi:hypothetical protein
MKLIQLGYCANLAYVIHVNEFGTTPAIKPCHFGMVYFGMMTIEIGLREKTYEQ